MSNNSSRSIHSVLDSLGVSYDEITVGDEEYLYTLGTGETSYSTGAAAFAYFATDLADLAGDADFAPPTYSDFCDAASAVDIDANDWDALAVALAMRGHRLTRPGCCSPALTDREYRLVRLAAGGVVES